MNTRILHVKGSDYAAYEYEKLVEDGTILPEVLWEQSYSAQDAIWHKKKFQYEAYKFGTVDPKFIEFVYNEVHTSDSADGNYFYII